MGHMELALALATSSSSVKEALTLSAPAPSLGHGSDSGLSDSEESVFSGLEDSGSDTSEEEDGASSGEQHSRTEKTTGQQAVLCASKLVSILSAAAPPRAGLHGGPFRSPPRGLETLDVGLVTLDVGLIWAWGSLPTLACVPTCPLLALGLACD
ncbi:hypothetical protein CB1_000574007 [Camelus ferus]|nr:hypothetical protein CB1_000574007 [Camelus ferus]